MLDHITFGVTDFDRSTAFYDKAFAPLGVRRLHDVPLEESGGARATGYGATRPQFWLVEQDPTFGKLHIALAAPSRGAVDAFHAAGLKAGGRNNGEPGLRLRYQPTYYAAFVLDPDGHNIEAVHLSAEESS